MLEEIKLSGSIEPASRIARLLPLIVLCRDASEVIALLATLVINVVAKKKQTKK